MRYISPETMSILMEDPFYKKCCFTGRTPVQFHHNLIYGYQQSDLWWTILPLHKDIHDTIDKKENKEKADWIMLNRAPEEDLKILSKAVNFIAKRDYLNEKYGKRT